MHAVYKSLSRSECILANQAVMREKNYPDRLESQSAVNNDANSLISDNRSR